MKTKQLRITTSHDFFGPKKSHSDTLIKLVGVALASRISETKGNTGIMENLMLIERIPHVGENHNRPYAEYQKKHRSPGVLARPGTDVFDWLPIRGAGGPPAVGLRQIVIVRS